MGELSRGHRGCRMVAFLLSRVSYTADERRRERDGGTDIDVFNGARFHEFVVAVCAAIGDEGVACC